LPPKLRSEVVQTWVSSRRKFITLPGQLSAEINTLGRYQADRPFRPWVVRIAINKCRDWTRRQTIRNFFGRAQPLSEHMTDTIADPAPGLDAILAGREDLERLWQAIALLPSALKEPLILRTVEGLSQAEAAAVLSITEKAVETRLHRARAKLAKSLAFSDHG
ncbi:MAG: RNA polymerase sigma factor, partial [Sphingobium sp.]